MHVILNSKKCPKPINKIPGVETSATPLATIMVAAIIFTCNVREVVIAVVTQVGKRLQQNIYIEKIFQ